MDINEKSRKGELRLDLREVATAAGESGFVAITPGKPQESEVVTRLFTKDKDEVMPPHVYAVYLRNVLIRNVLVPFYMISPVIRLGHIR
jgi:hypothetical protein